MLGGASGGPLFSRERSLFRNGLNPFLSFFSASSLPLSLPFSFLPFSFEGTLTLLFEFFFTLRERDVEGSAQTKGRDIHRDTKRKQRSPVSVRAGGRGHGQ